MANSKLKFGDSVKKLRFIALFVLAGVFLFPIKASARWLDWFNPSEIIESLIVEPLKDACTFLLSKAFEGITYVVSQPTDIDSLPYIGATLLYAQRIAMSLAVISFLYQLLKRMIEQGYGDGGKPVEILIGQAIKTVALIYLSPWILKEVLIKANNALLPVVSSIGVSIGGYDPNLSDNLAAAVVNHSIMLRETTGVIILMLLLLVILIIGLIILVILASIRLAQLGFLAAIGPILAVSAQDKGEAFNTWIREAVAVTFTQLLHVWLLGYLMNLIMSGDFWNMLASIGVLVIMIGGPSVIKPYLHSSGVGGAITGTGRAIAYRAMLRGAVGR